MTESSKTLTYVVIAAVMTAAGIFLAPGGSRVRPDAVADLIGAEFYPEFKSSADATAIDVIGYDAATATVTPFSVKYENGLWRIPTRHNYPADGKDRLAKVAASIIGLKREALAGKSEAEQVEFQTLDPQADKAENLKGIGNRVTLKKGETVLADYIIGKAVPNKTGYFYVRKPDEKQTFMAKVDLNLSTKFTDWIESDVLAVEGTRLTQVDIRKHTLEITREGVDLAGEENNLLTRKNSSDPWALAGVDDATEEVNQDEVRKLVSALDDLKIVGVRPKPESLKRDLADNEGIQLDQRTAEDLADRGFFFLRTQRGPRLVSREGDLFAGTDQAVEYEIRFGDAFEGTTEEIEFEFAKPKDDAEQPADGDKPAEEKTADEKTEEKPDAEKSEADKPEADKPTGKKKSRYMFVTARVNPELLGPEPVEPTKPEPPSEKSAAEETPADEKPAEDKPADEEATDEKKPDARDDDKSKEEPSAAEDSDADEPAPEEKSTDETPAEENAAEEKPEADEKPKDETTEDNPADDAKETPPTPPVDPQKVYEEALKKYDADKLKYVTDLKSRETKLKEAEEKVKALNARFAEWYYVISAENFENMRQGRSTLVKEKENPAGETTPEGDKSEEDKSESETPEGDAPKGDGTDKPEEEPADKSKDEPSEQPESEDKPKDTPESEE